MLMFYWFGSYLFAGGAYRASTAIIDKASAASMMSFINMGFAMLSVIAMGHLAKDPFVAFITILFAVFLLVLALLFLSYKKLDDYICVFCKKTTA